MTQNNKIVKELNRAMIIRIILVSLGIVILSIFFPSFELLFFYSGYLICWIFTMVHINLGNTK